MKKKIFIAVSVVLLAALVYGLMEFFRTPTKACDLNSEYEGEAKAFVDNIHSYKTQAVVKLMDTIVSAESKSITLPMNTIVVKDSSEMKEWPKEGYVVIQGFYQGIEIDEFFGDTLIRIGGACLLNSDDSEDLD